MPINKVVFGNTTLIDLSNSTLTNASSLMLGITAYDRAGNLLTGTASPSGGEWTSGIYQDSNGYIKVSPYPGAGGIIQDSNNYIIMSTSSLSYTVTNQLIECVNSNNSTYVQKGEAYTAVLTANSDYVLDEVTITMGGVDVTENYYSGGTTI